MTGGPHRRVREIIIRNAVAVAPSWTAWASLRQVKRRTRQSVRRPGGGVDAAGAHEQPNGQSPKTAGTCRTPRQIVSDTPAKRPARVVVAQQGGYLLSVPLKPKLVLHKATELGVGGQPPGPICHSATTRSRAAQKMCGAGDDARDPSAGAASSTRKSPNAVGRLASRSAHCSAAGPTSSAVAGRALDTRDVRRRRGRGPYTTPPPGPPSSPPWPPRSSPSSTKPSVKGSVTFVEVRGP